jgi:hypothetical protein
MYLPGYRVRNASRHAGTEAVYDFLGACFCAGLIRRGAVPLYRKRGQGDFSVGVRRVAVAD